MHLCATHSRHAQHTVGMRDILSTANNLAFFDLTSDIYINIQIHIYVLFAYMQNILSKAIKYALFDPTKEMAYIPLDQESKVRVRKSVCIKEVVCIKEMLGILLSLRYCPPQELTV